MHKVIISYIIMYYQVPSYKQSGRFFQVILVFVLFGKTILRYLQNESTSSQNVSANKMYGTEKITNRKQNPCNFFFQKLIKSILNVSLIIKFLSNT